MHANWTRALLIAAAWALTPGARAQDAPAPEPPAAPAPTPDPAPEPEVRFNLNGMPYDQVLDVISRQTGLPVIRQCEVPNATMTFISPEAYTLPKAVEIINLAFKAHGVRLEQDERFLYLRTIADVARRPTPVGSADQLDGLEAGTYATVFIPLENAIAGVVAERLKPLVAEPGLVQAIQEQNLLILVETGEQCRRLSELVERIDAERPADVGFAFYPLTHTEAGKIVETLRSLVPERDQVVSMDKNQQPQTYDDVSKPPLKLSADDRLNAVVAVGPPTRLDVVQELVTMLDVPAGAGADGAGTRRTRTFTLEELTPDEAARQLAPLFADQPERVRPILQALPSVSKLVAVGTDEQIARLSAVLEELDPGVLGREGQAMPVTRAIGFEHLRARDAENLARRLMSARQQRATRIATSPDGRGLIASGPDEDVRALEDLLRSLDTPPERDTEARSIAIRRGDPDAVVAEALRVDGLTDDGARDPATATVDTAARSAVVVGSPEAIARVERRVREVEDALARRVQTRVIDVRAVDAGGLVDPILQLVRASEDASGHAEPDIRVIERSNSLVVTADDAVLRLVEQFAQRLDRVEQRPASAWRSFDLRVATAADVARQLEQALNDRARWPEELLRAERSGQGPARATARAEAATNRVVVNAPEGLMALAQEIVNALDAGQEPAPVEVRAFRLREGDANSVATALRTGLAADVRPGEPQPSVAAEAGSNTVIVTGSASAMRRAEDLVAAMDERVEVGGLGVRTIVLRHARAEVVAPLVERVLGQDRVVDLVPEWLRWQMVWELERRNRPVDLQRVRVQADDRMNALVVSAPLELLDLAQEIAQSLDVEASADATGDRPVRVVPLVSADASQVEGAVRAMFEGSEGTAQPPTVRADRSSNALVVRGSAAQLEAIEGLARRLDAAAGASTRGVRTIPLDPSRLDAEEAARTIRRLLERRGGVRVEVITADELLEESGEPAAPGQQETPGDEGEAEGEPRSDAGWGSPWAWTLGPVVGWAPAAEPAEEDEAVGEPEVPVVRIVVDPATNSLVIEGSGRISDRVQELAAELQRRSPREPTAVRIVELPAGADPNAIASFVNQTVRQLGRTGQDNPGGFTGRVAVSPDRASGTLVVWANDTDFGTVKDLVAGLTRLDRTVSLSVKIYPLDNTQAARARQSVMQLLNPQRGPGRRTGEIEITIPDGEGGQQTATIDPSRVTVTTDPSLTSLIVTAPADAFRAIDRFVEMIDESPVLERLAIRRYPLEHASAQDLQRTLQVLFDSQRQGPLAWEQPRARFVADDRANALLVTATDEQHGEITRILEDADQSLEADDSVLEIIAVSDGRPSSISRVIQEVLVGRDPAKKDALRLSPQDDTGVLVVRAPKGDLEEIRSLVKQLDQTQGASYPVRSIKLENGDAGAIATSLQQFFRDRARINRQRGIRTGGGDAAIVGDRRSGTIVVSASDGDYEQIAGLVERFDTPAEGREFQYKIIPLEHIRVSDIQQTVQSIANELQWERSGWFRGQRGGSDEEKLYIETNDRTNSVVLFGQGDLFGTVEKIVGELDQPGSDAGKVVVRAVRAPGVDLNAVERIIEQMTATPGWRWWQGRDPNAVQVEVDRRRQTLILVGLRAVVEDAAAQVAEIVEGGLDEGQVVEIVPLREARAGELARALQSALPEGLTVKITPVSRTNSIMLTGSGEDVAIVKKHIDKLDQEPERAPVEFRRFALQHADAADLSIVLRALVRNRPRGQGEPVPGIDALYNENTLAVTASPAEMAFISEMVGQFDVAQETERRTEFVKLEFADAGQTAEALKVFYGRFAPEAATSAERSVSIVPDPASNSLVISADESTWEGIHELLTKLDTPEYDVSQQLVVIPLKHASAAGVARALNEGFRQPLEDQLDRERVRLEAERRRQGNNSNNRDFFEPAVLVESEGVPVVSAETQTNSLIVFAGRNELDRIRQIVAQLDVPDFLELPPARIVPIRAGRASQLAESARRVFVTEQDGANPRRVQIIGDDASDTVLVRADDGQFEEIRSFLADMEARASRTQASVRVIRLGSIPASRVQQAVLQSLRPVAQERGEPLSVQVEATTNALIVSTSEEVHRQVEKLVRELDGEAARPGDREHGDAGVRGFGRDVTLVPVRASDPARVVQALNQMGVTRAQPATSPGVVAEPVGLIPLPDQSAIGVVGSERDTAVVRRLIEALDAEGDAEQRVAFVRLKLADANAVVQRVRGMLAANTSVTRAGAAGALAEQVRRLRLERDGRPVELDLTTPVRLVPEPGSNAVIVASSGANVAAIESVIRLLDKLPIGEAVMVKIFPLENASAERVRTIVNDLFRQGNRVRRVPGTNRQGQPTTTVGRALSGNVALTTDERTNALVAAGPEASLALVEVIVADLDKQDAERGWLETSLIQLEHADARALAEKLRAVLVEGIGQTPDAVALRRQIGRLRVGGAEGAAVEADLYAPLAGVVITPEEDLNALIVVATPTNVRAIKELVVMLDVERASASNEVRVIPLEHADAGRVADIVKGTFEERSRLPSARPEDRVIVSVDERTNALIVSTSRRSFEILDGLLATLDQPEARFAVGLHVIPVPGADVEALAPRLERLMQDRLRAARQRGAHESSQDVFRVEADPAAGVLIVVASEENLQLVRELVSALTTGEAPAAKGEVTALVQLSSPGRAEEIADAVGELYVRPQNERRGARSVTVVANERLNALLVTGSEDDVAQIRGLADRLDRAEVGLVEEVRRIPLQSASARETVDLIEDVLAGRSIAGSRTGSRATRVRVISERLEQAKAEATIDGDIRDQVNLTPDPRTNSVLVKAPPELMELITTIVRDLDDETRGDRVIETFRLQNADAAQMQQLLIDLFNLQQSGDRYVLAPTAEPPSDDEAQPGVRAFTAIPDERQELAVTIDRRTNTVLVSGTADLIEEVRRVIASLDDIEANERERLVYHLKNAQAAEIEQTLQAYFNGEANLVRTTLGPEVSGSVLRELEQEVTVIGDPNSNKLVISASPRYIDTVTSIIDELDASPPQVMIEVLIAEVTLNASEEFGIDVAIGGTVATTSGGGLGTQTEGSRVGGDGYVFDALAAGTGVATALGVPNLAVASSDFGLLIRALQAQGKLEVLSRPQVQVNDNEAAFINVGENIAITDGVERRDNVTTAIVRREDVGITLDVTPSISSDGYVRLDISPEISILSDRTTQISEGFEAPIITQRRVETTVTIKDGETVVIGGLIQTNDSQTKTKVPVLGDIPLVGGLFKTNEKSQIKTELLVILTPHVIPGERNARSLEQQRSLTDRAMNSLESREPVEKMLELGHDPDDKVEIWEPLDEDLDD